MKFVVGVMLTGFGTFWSGEGIGIDWPAGDLAILALLAGYLVVALAGVQIVRSGAAGRLGPASRTGPSGAGASQP
jgi:Ca2+/H+ antiporter, TMEM165/GDT1 family